MIPMIRGLAEADAVGGDVEEDKEALFDGDDGVDLRGDVCDDPVGQVAEGLLVHLRVLFEARGHVEEHEVCALGARTS